MKIGSKFPIKSFSEKKEESNELISHKILNEIKYINTWDCLYMNILL